MPAENSCFRVFIALMVLASAALAQNSPVPPVNPPSRFGPAPQQVTAAQKRDAEHVADAVAKLFRAARKQAKQPWSWRFHCAAMARYACDAAVKGQPGGTGTPSVQALYWTHKPDQPSPEFERLAKFDTRTNDPKFWAERFSVVVWPTDDPKSYWVAIDLHPNVVLEALWNAHAFLLVCDGPCSDREVAPECEKVK